MHRTLQNLHNSKLLELIHRLKFVTNEKKEARACQADRHKWAPTKKERKRRRRRAKRKKEMMSKWRFLNLVNQWKWIWLHQKCFQLGQILRAKKNPNYFIPKYEVISQPFLHFSFHRRSCIMYHVHVSDCDLIFAIAARRRHRHRRSMLSKWWIAIQVIH